MNLNFSSPNSLLSDQNHSPDQEGSAVSLYLFEMLLDFSKQHVIEDKWGGNIQILQTSCMEL